MYKYENDCVGCPPEMGCLGSLCPYKHNMVLTCDRCGGETDILYIRNGEELCKDCLENELDIRDYYDIPDGDPICHTCADAAGGHCREETFVYSEEDEKWICEKEFLNEHEQMNVEDCEEQYGEEHEDGF